MENPSSLSMAGEGYLTSWTFKDIGSLRTLLGLDMVQTACLAPKSRQPSKTCTKKLAKAAAERIERNLNLIQKHGFPSDAAYECLWRLAVSCVCSLNRHHLKDSQRTTPEKSIYDEWHGKLWSECVLFATGGPATGELVPPPLYDRKRWNDALARIPKLETGTTMARQGCKSEGSDVADQQKGPKRSFTLSVISSASSSSTKEPGFASQVMTLMRPILNRAVAGSQVTREKLFGKTASQQNNFAAASSSGGSAQLADSGRSLLHEQPSPQEDVDEPHVANAADEDNLGPLCDPNAPLAYAASPDSLLSVAADSTFSEKKSEGGTPASDYGSEQLLHTDKAKRSDASSPLSHEMDSPHGFPAIERDGQRKKIGRLGGQQTGTNRPHYGLKNANTTTAVSSNDDPFVTVATDPAATADKATNTDPVATTDKVATTDSVATADEATTTIQATPVNPISCIIKVFKHQSHCQINFPELESLNIKYEVEECKCDQAEEIKPLALSEKGFEDYYEESDGPVLLKELLKKICLPLFEESRTDSGWIYGYTRPGGQHYIKIGKEKNPGERKKKWEKQCKYTVKPLFRVRMPYAAGLMEELVHTTLWKSRKLDSHCVLAKTPSCPVKKGHDEWFRISMVDALEQICLWQRFNISQPYDEYGRLKDFWYGRAYELLKQSQEGLLNPNPDPKLWVDKMPAYIELASSLTQEGIATPPEVSLVISLKNKTNGQRVDIARRVGSEDVLIKSFHLLKLS